MSKHKNLIRRSAAGLILLLAFLLCACGQDPSSSAEGQTNSTPTLPVLHSSKTDDPASSAGEITQDETDPASDPAGTTAAPGPTQMTDTEYTGPEFDYTRFPERIILRCEDFGITRIKSPYDKDGDGIDDQTDFFLGAKAYISQNLQYDASSYYSNGYPEADAEGVVRSVCTDVIGAAFMAAGYDLRALVDKDIQEHREWFTTDLAAQGLGQLEDFKVGDSKIDFRRVRNVWVLLEHHAESLTLDLSDQAAWQPGDIAIFWDNVWHMHIVMISDRRASDGVPYVIHHASKGQTLFEEDYMVSATKKLIGHYRWNGYNGE